MKKSIKDAVKEYQCCGCVGENVNKCYVVHQFGGVGCGKHRAGTTMSFIGKIFLGLPNGFNRLGQHEDLVPKIYKTFPDSSEYDKWNVPVWKYLNEKGHTLIRGIMPRKNEPFLHIILEDCLDKIDCQEITQDDIDYMD
jgi:hypothetical protein